MATMKRKAEVVCNDENCSKARGQKSRKLKLNLVHIHHVIHCMYDLEQVLSLFEVQFLIYKVQLITA